MNNHTDRYANTMLLESLIAAIHPIDIKGNHCIPVHRICNDSREICTGDVFVAIRGTHTDGHAFIHDAVRRGATVIIYDNENALKEQISRLNPSHHPLPVLVRVMDTARIFPILVALYYGNPSTSFRIIGITGTNGKTTTSLLIQSILAESGLNVGRIGTLGYCWNNRQEEAPLTTPDPCILQKIFKNMADDGVDTAVMEVSSHALSQHRVAGCSYDVAVFTNLTQDHLDYHGNIEQYFRAKARLFLEYLKPGGTAIINLDDPWGIKLQDLIKSERSQEVNILTYGIETYNIDISASEIQCTCNDTKFRLSVTPHNSTTFIAPCIVSSRLLGKLNVYNILAAISAVYPLKIPEEAVINGIRKIDRVDGRLEKVSISADYTVIVDYAHTPDAMQKSLSCVREWTKGRLIVVFGCGGDRDRSKRPTMARVASKFADIIIITSDNPRTESPDQIIDDIVTGIPKNWQKISTDKSYQGLQGNRIFIIESNRRKAIELAIKNAFSGDTVFIGGKGHETYQIIGHQKYPLDDRVVVMEYLNRHHE